MTDTDDRRTPDVDAQTPDRDAPDPTSEGSVVADGNGTGDGGQPPSRESFLGDLRWDDVRQNLTIGAIAVLALLATWAVFQVYASTSRAIAIWFSEDYVPLFEAAFNLVVVLVAVAGIVVLLRALT